MQTNTSAHTFHIPVMGLGYTVDTPVKVAQYGISSVVSIMDDQLLEVMRKIYSHKWNIPYKEIPIHLEDSRAKRITSYLNLLHDIIDHQMKEMQDSDLGPESPLTKYLELLPIGSPLSLLEEELKLASSERKEEIIQEIKDQLVAGNVDVNIMTKVDKLNYDENGNELPREFSDALSALRGFAQSKLHASVIFSAGMNPALYGYLEKFPDFFPDHTGAIAKRVILKVSDYRSALIQGKFLAKKGVWVSEFRIESGLNCGGHAFATDGFLIGPILEEFKQNRTTLTESIFQTCQQALAEKGLPLLPEQIGIKITYQGGIGTATEDSFLRNYYELDGTGWGSPFLLVPEATSVDDDTIQRIIKAKNSDFYLSYASPLGIPFNNLRTSSGEEQRQMRIEKHRPGSPCYKKFLSFSKEFTKIPICTASRQYQSLKTKQFEKGEISRHDMDLILEKDCLCEGLSAPAILANGEIPKRNLTAVTICPGPNLAYFKGIFSLKEMVDHIYGKINLKLELERPHVFVKELQLYVTYLKKEFDEFLPEKSTRKEAYLDKFRKNLIQGVEYYQNLVNSFQVDSEEIMEKMKHHLLALQGEIENLELKLVES
ncbi:MAG: hypothetical protein PSV36_08445 [Algoriphagus sp.]|nr:hypothetical protein [Algoriphagus sp.]